MEERIGQIEYVRVELVTGELNTSLYFSVVSCNHPILYASLAPAGSTPAS